MTPWWISLAVAAPLEEYARRAPVALPETGIALVEVPAELLDPVFSAEHSDVLLVDAAGTVLPLARVLGGAARERVNARFTLESPGLWRATELERTVDVVIVRLRDHRAATVTVTGPNGLLASPARVWNLGPSQQSAIVLDRPVLGDLAIALVPDPPASADVIAEIELLTGPAEPTADLRWVPVTDFGWAEGGTHRYQVDVPADLPVSALRFDPADDIFDRKVGVVRGLGGLGPRARPHPVPPLDGEIARRAFGGSRHDRTRVALAPSAGDRLEIAITGEPALHISEVGLEVPGLWVLARDVGPGPHFLYGAGPAGDAAGELQIADDELLRMATVRVEAGAAEANPTWIPPETGISEPGAPADLSRMRVERDLGGEGLVRIPLDAHVLGTARGDLGDLRLVDPSGRQIPFILRERPGEMAANEVRFDRTESGSRSRLRVKLADPNVPVSSITLTTSARAFSREIRVMRERAAHLEPVRAWTWTSDRAGGGLTLDLSERFGDELVVEIDNGDDAPLPIETVKLGLPAWELVALVPPGGATLVYGDPRTLRPTYDLDQVRDRLLRRSPAVATVGEPRSRVKVAPWFDRVLAALGVAALAIGLLILTGSVLRAVPPPEAET